MEKLTSADGVTIALDRTGDGPALVVVVGAFCDRFTSKAFAATMAPFFTVYEYDRRGRGDSSDAPSYDVQREYDDLDAVVTAAGGSAFVYGHSSGAALALEAAARGVPMRKLAAYEPPFIRGDAARTGFADELRELLAAGKRAEAAESFMVYTGVPPEVASTFSSAPYWDSMVALAHTLPYDVTLCDVGSAGTRWFADIPVPVLTLAGGNSAPWAAEAVREIAETAPDARYRVIEGQGHDVSDDAVVPLLKEFFV